MLLTLRSSLLIKINNFFLSRGKTKAVFIKDFWSDAGTFETLLKSSNFIQSKINKKVIKMKLIDGVVLKELKPILDERGYLQECFRSDWLMYNKFGQAYITVAFPNIVKAWHYHKIQTDNMVCIAGNAKLVLFDDRKDSITKNEINEIFFGEKKPLLVSIPHHIWHGFKAMGGKRAMILNCPTDLYNYSTPDEFRLPYDTEEINYDWEVKMG